VNRASLMSMGIIAVALALATACGGGAAPTSAPTAAPTATTVPLATTEPVATIPPTETSEPTDGDGDLVPQGQALFTEKLICQTCHIIEGLTTGPVGPELTHIGTDAAGRRPGLSAEEYIEESIRDPEAFVATGVPRAIPGVMTKAITEGLSDDEVQALVAFLLAQK